MIFKIGQILSVHTEMFYCESIDELYEFLDYMTGDNLFSTQLPRAAKTCQKHLAEQFPWLKDVDVRGIDSSNWKPWLANCKQRFGDYHEVEPLPIGVWMKRDPVGEAQEIAPHLKVFKIGDGNNQN